MLLPGIAQGLPSIDNGELFVAATNFNSVQAGDLLFAGVVRTVTVDILEACPNTVIFGSGWNVILSASGCFVPNQAEPTTRTGWRIEHAVHQYVSGSVPSITGSVDYRVVLRNTKTKALTQSLLGASPASIANGKRPRCIVQCVRGGDGTSSFSTSFSFSSAPALGTVDGRSRDAEYQGNNRNRLGVWFEPFVDNSSIAYTGDASQSSTRVVFLQ